ncbi:AraC family transcriptional regulator [Sphingobacterium sp. SRCM116780]|uniref:helix-turn-helix domain-containing protein n=1 Tax=Sphingobacterium sp. SRCM116780 TaxID=2907623 RepID=UPI001F3DB5C4|nr:AraC family transcriptional regulator [Sphingobacterium sp. SRCM116780]UIR56867.1 AraC family transcriptional regulator [Sphingobacterium sp. SRCM116780]
METEFFDIKTTISRFIDDKNIVNHTLIADIQNSCSYLDEFAIVTFNAPLANLIPFKPKHYFLIIGITGTCHVTAGYHTFEILPDTISLLAANQLCCFTDSSDDFRADVILFKKDFLTESYVKDPVIEELVYINPDYPPTYLLTEEQNRVKIRHKFEDIQDEFKQQGPFYLNIIRLKIIELLYDYNRACEYCLLLFKKQMNRQYQLTYSFKRLVDEKFLSIKTVAEYASLLNISPKYLSDTIKSETGTAALDIVHKRLLMEAQYLLKYSKKSIKEIAGILGFDSTSHFCRFFKRKVGTTPLKYKGNR